VKLLGKGELTSKLDITVYAATASARRRWRRPAAR
jgi:ribosomal protein L15